MATLTLIRFDGSSDYALQGTGDPSQNADFSLYDLDGEGGDPFRYGNTSWEIVNGIPAEPYDPSDSDTFWAAQQGIIEAMRAAGLEVPDYVD